MKRKLICILICICLVLCAMPAGSGYAAADVCFIAINDDQLLELTYMPYTYGSNVYVPYWVFTSYGFGIYYSYFAESSTALLYSGTGKQIFFELSSGNSYDGSGEYYSTQAVLRNGTVYLPVAFMCRYFGAATYSYITGSEYGDILRIKSGSVILTDIEFQRAASSLMQSRYNAYMSAGTATEPPVPQIESQTPEIAEGGDICLSFIGLPQTGVLASLKRQNVKACFFLTEEDIRSDPDAVRHIAGEGHSVGIFCESDTADEYQAASELLFEAARVKTLLVTAVGENSAPCREAAEEAGLVFWSYDLDAMYAGDAVVSAYNITAVLGARAGETSVFMNSAAVNDNVASIILHYITINNYSVYQPRETSVWEQ